MTWMDTVQEITNGDRRRDYGRPLINHLRIAIRWSNLLGVSVTPDQVVMMMLDLKIAREQNTAKEDNWIDMLGYLACASDMNEQMKELAYPDGLLAFADMDTVDLQRLYDELLDAEED